MHPSFVEYKMLLFTIYIQYLTSTSVYLLKLCTVVKYAVLVTKDLLATLKRSGRHSLWVPGESLAGGRRRTLCYLGTPVSRL